MNESLIDNLKKMMDYGMLGVYRRKQLIDEHSDIKTVPALIKACSMGAWLNRKYKLFDKDGNGILPQTESELFLMFEHPVAEMIDGLPEPYRTQATSDVTYYGTDELIDDGDNDIIITEDGYMVLEINAIAAAKDKVEQINEYDEYNIYQNMNESNYVDKRLFIISGDNDYISVQDLLVNEDKRRFKENYPELFQLVYKRNERTDLYRCYHCGMILKERKAGDFSCVSKECNRYLDKKIKMDTTSGWIMRDVVVQSIRYPGQLEIKIKDVLEKAIEKGTVKSYDIWPGKWEGTNDTWDFRVYMSNGSILLLDAKNVTNLYWIINDKREYMDGAKFWYVVPDSKEKRYVDIINENIAYDGIAGCLKVRELKKMLGVK